MNLNEKEIIDLIKSGESQKVEFKEKIPSSTIIARTLSSFANTEGGILFIGISDSGSIKGLTQAELNFGIGVLKQITNSLFDYEIPIYIHSLEGKEIIVVEIRKNKGDSLPIITASGEMYLREKQATKKAIEAIMNRNMSHNIGSHILNAPKTEETGKSKKKDIKVFVAMSFREEEEPALIDYYRAMERAVDNVKQPISISRMDRIEGDYEISQQIMDEIDKSDIVVADFTLSSQNVYFELGYARAKAKRIIQTARKDTRLEFDTRNWKTIIYRNATELETKLEIALKAAYEQFA